MKRQDHVPPAEAAKVARSATLGPLGDGHELLRTNRIPFAEYQNLVSLLGREPTQAELGVCSAMWSEHCSYKSSRVHLKRLPTTGANVVVGPGENAGIVRLEGELCLAFKMESHNHPSYIEPYQGAATGVGGIMRDVFCMGARPIANLNCLRFGPRAHPKTQHLLENVVKGIGDYGNCVGIPTVAGDIDFDPSYAGNCLVNAMTVGLIRETEIFKGYASGVGNLVVYVGSATGRDGIHGATMASDSFSGSGESSRTTVQVGDPFAEKLLLEATLELLRERMVVGLQDMGAAGLTSSAFEMASRAGNGIYLNLDLVPQRAANMSAYEIMLSESQERMLLVLTEKQWQDAQQVLSRWGLHYAIIGSVTATGRVVIDHRGLREVDMPVSLADEHSPKYERPMRPRVAIDHGDDGSLSGEKSSLVGLLDAAGFAAVAARVLHASGNKAPIYAQYDHHIGLRTVLGPPDGGAAVMRVHPGETTPGNEFLGVAAAAGCVQRIGSLDPRVGAEMSVLKPARMLFATGAEPLAVTDCLNFGNPEDPTVMWEFSEAVDGIASACRELGIPVVSGNVSLYNETDGVSIAPSPMIGMVGRVSDVRRAAPANAAQAGEFWLLRPKGRLPSLSGSLVSLAMTGSALKGRAPQLLWDAEREAGRFLGELARKFSGSGGAYAARDVGESGLAGTALKMVLKSRRFSLSLDVPQGLLDQGTESANEWLWGELPGAYLLQGPDLGGRLQGEPPLRYNELLKVGSAREDSHPRWTVGTERGVMADLQVAFDSFFAH